MSIALEQITKRFDGVPVVNDVTLTVESGEFFVLLGPSGSGKSTLLRVLAGLTHLDHGRVSLHGHDVTHAPARERGVGFVFQHYALFRHMTVADNIEFALRVRGVRRTLRRKRRAELLRLVSLEGLDARLPIELSGGQQQRVAVARALAHEPAVLLLDEPFGALDAKIRVEVRETVRDVQRRVGITTILVTHDQEEAFALADRLGVMHQGRLLETGRSEKLYARPATRFVATFLGAANLFMGERSPRGLKLGEVLLAPSETLLPHSDDRAEVVTVVRPEDIEVADAPQHLASRVFAAGYVQTISFAGSIERLTVQLADHTSVLAATAPEAITAQPPLIETTRTRSEQSELALTVGRRVALGLRRFHVLPTPISSFVIATADAEQRARLEAAPLLAHLIASMRARVLESTPSAHGAGGPPQAGVVVVAKAQGSARELATLIAGGTSRILSLPEHCELPRQLLFYADTDASRRGALGLVASVMRHLTAAATLVTVQPTATPRIDVSIAFRRLLDARAELQAAHGLDIRTDVHLGELEDWVMGVAASAEPVLVILGIESESAVSEEQLRDRFRALLAPENRCAVLLAATRASNGAREFGAATMRPSSARA